MLWNFPSNRVSSLNLVEHSHSTFSLHPNNGHHRWRRCDFYSNLNRTSSLSIETLREKLHARKMNRMKRKKTLFEIVIKKHVASGFYCWNLFFLPLSSRIVCICIADFGRISELAKLMWFSRERKKTENEIKFEYSKYDYIKVKRTPYSPRRTITVPFSSGYCVSIIKSITTANEHCL